MYFFRKGVLGMNLRFRLCPIAIYLTALAAPALHADTVVMKNGDRLTGTTIKLEAGKLTFKAAYADPIALAWDQVASLTLSQALGTL
jgi:hypothetical protein